MVMHWYPGFGPRLMRAASATGLMLVADKRDHFSGNSDRQDFSLAHRLGRRLCAGKVCVFNYVITRVYFPDFHVQFISGPLLSSPPVGRSQRHGYTAVDCCRQNA